METLAPKYLKEQARMKLRRGRDPKKLVLWYAGLVVGLSLAINLINLWLNHQMASQGGLSNLGNLAILDTISQSLPLLVSLLTMCLNLGYLSGMMRVSRGQYADHTDLKAGFPLFWPMLRLTILLGIAYFAVIFVAFQVSYFLFMLTPWSQPLMEYLTPLTANGMPVMDESMILGAMEHMVPLFLLFAIVSLAFVIPVIYWFRMSSYCLVDDPNAGARAAMAASRKMMKGKFLTMLKIDLSLWPYHATSALMSLVLYADLLLPALGVNLPISGTTLTYVCFGLALAIQFATLVLLRNRAECTYLLVYDQLREKPKSGETILGSIFD